MLAVAALGVVGAVAWAVVVSEVRNSRAIAAFIAASAAGTGAIGALALRPRRLAVMEHGLLVGASFVRWSRIDDWNISGEMLSVFVRERVNVLGTDGDYRYARIRTDARAELARHLTDHCPPAQAPVSG